MAKVTKSLPADEHVRKLLMDIANSRVVELTELELNNRTHEFFDPINSFVQHRLTGRMDFVIRGFYYPGSKTAVVIKEEEKKCLTGSKLLLPGKTKNQ